MEKKRKDYTIPFALLMALSLCAFVILTVKGNWYAGIWAGATSICSLIMLKFNKELKNK